MRDDAVPTAVMHSRVPFHLRDKVIKELQHQEQLGLIESVTKPTPWVHRMVIVPKPRDPDAIRLTLDLREVNKFIVPDHHPLPTIEEVIQECLTEAYSADIIQGDDESLYFSIVDLDRGYHQCELHPDSRSLTAFATPLGVKQYTRLVQGISPASDLTIFGDRSERTQGHIDFKYTYG